MAGIMIRDLDRQPCRGLNFIFCEHVIDIHHGKGCPVIIFQCGTAPCTHRHDRIDISEAECIDIAFFECIQIIKLAGTNEGRTATDLFFGNDNPDTVAFEDFDSIQRCSGKAHIIHATNEEPDCCLYRPCWFDNVCVYQFHECGFNPRHGTPGILDQCSHFLVSRECEPFFVCECPEFFDCF